MKNSSKKILFIGLGGAGQRHLRIVKSKFEDAKLYGLRRKKNTPSLNPDFTIKKSSTLEKDYNLQLIESIEEIKKIQPNLTVIASPSAMHCSDILYAAESGSDIIVEKPGAMSSEEAKKIKKVVLEKKLKFLVSFQRRFHPLVKKFRENILNNKIGKASYIKISTKSFVPDWHPYEDFRNLYACRKDLGGGVIPTEIHEIDIILWIFGNPNKIEVSSSNSSNFNLDVEDTAFIRLSFDNLVVEADLCFMDKDAKREIFVEGECGSMKLDLIHQNLEINKNESNKILVNSNIQNDDQFREQLNFFFHEQKRNSQTYLNAIINNSKIIERR